MTIKSVLQRIASWFKGSGSAVGTAVAATSGADVAAVSAIPSQETTMPEATTPATVDKVAVTVQIALLLKSVDASLTTEQVQAATAAALAAAYPAA